MLFRWMPVPGTTTPLPEPSDADSDAALPEAIATPAAGAAPERVRSPSVAASAASNTTGRSFSTAVAGVIWKV